MAQMLALVDDLMFLSRIREAARPLSRVLALASVLLAISCTGSSTSPRPESSPTPEPHASTLRPLSSRDGASATTAPRAVGSADAAATLPPGHPPVGGVPPAAGAPASGANRVSGTISLAPSLTSGPGDVLYVMAKKDGSTLAVLRAEAPSFPFAFELSKANAMVSGIALEGPVDIVARVSRTGDAIASPGDLEGTTTGVAVPATRVDVTIDRVRE